MKYLAFASLTLFALVTGIALFMLVTAIDANAVVCVRRACTERAAPVHTALSLRTAHIAAPICEQGGTDSVYRLGLGRSET